MNLITRSLGDIRVTLALGVALAVSGLLGLVGLSFDRLLWAAVGLGASAFYGCIMLASSYGHRPNRALLAMAAFTALVVGAVSVSVVLLPVMGLVAALFLITALNPRR